MQIRLVALNPIIGNINGNGSKILTFIKSALKDGVDLIIFSELILTGYPPKDLLFFSNLLLTQQKKWLTKIKACSDQIAIVIGAIDKNEKSNPLYFNQALFISKQKIHRYNKQLLPNYDVFDEPRYFKNGTQPTVIHWRGFKLGLTVCEDIWWGQKPIKQRYASNPLLAYKKAKLDLLINISASPFTLNKARQRQAVLTQTAKFVQAPVLYVNQVGANDGLVFDGCLSYTLKSGKTVAQSVTFAESLLDINLSSLKTKISSPSEIQNLKQALVLGIRDYVHKSGFTQAHLGISGGIDSAVVAWLACEALGAKNVTGLILPSRFTHKKSTSCALELANNLKMKSTICAIQKLVAVFSMTIPFQPLSDLTQQNLQARVRGLLLMAHANQTSSLLLNTTNKSELAFGYGTLYGDLCGALAVLGDVTKKQVYELAKLANAQENIIPEFILTRAPSAELKPNQRDSDNLPPYPQIDKSLDQLFALTSTLPFNLTNNLHAKLFKNLLDHQHKRHQLAPVIKVSETSFGCEWRLPIVTRMQF